MLCLTDILTPIYVPGTSCTLCQFNGLPRRLEVGNDLALCVHAGEEKERERKTEEMVEEEEAVEEAAAVAS